MNGLHNRKEAVRELQIDTSTFKLWIDKGMPVVRQEGNEYFDLQQIQAWREEVINPISNMEIGKIYNNREISTAFKCSEQGGMRRSHLTNTLVLFSDHTKGVYEDRTIIDKDGNE